MKIFIVFTNETRSHAIVTRQPSWIARLFGRRSFAAEVKFDSAAPFNWRYAVDLEYVNGELGRQLDWHRKWQKAEPLPIAEIRRLDGIVHTLKGGKP